MKTYIIKSIYEYEIRAKDSNEALEKWNDIFRDEIDHDHEYLLEVFIGSLVVKNYD